MITAKYIEDCWQSKDPCDDENCHIKFYGIYDDGILICEIGANSEQEALEKC